MTKNIKPTKLGRPQAFDDRVVSYMPGLRGLASRLGFRGEERDDLVTDTMMTALHRWGSFREDGGFWNWLSLTMRACAQERRKAARRMLTLVDDGDGRYANRMALQPPQLRQIEAIETVRAIKGRDGDALVRLAMGDTLDEIGRKLGVSRERVRQICERGRSRLTALREAA
ncbi:sigma-70 family RNA polymerase sigma factor [Rhizobium sp.]|uniref:sigma-70 family RNA polymerase sigma factor n=1 Tax=Rhizobium sp. TaxID=391 RepID=UPI00289A4BA8